MTNFKFRALRLPGLFLISPFLAEDERGYFLKNYERDIFASQGIVTDVYEIFESYSFKNVLRGLHFQTENPQAKLVRCVLGKIYDVAVDVRKDSPTFGQWEGVYLDDVTKQSLFVPAGFAHGFMALTNSVTSYICSGKYSKGTDTGIRWDDPDIGIIWPVNRIGECVISERDKQLQSFKEYAGI